MANSLDIKDWANLGKSTGYAYMIVCMPKDSDKADVVFCKDDTVHDQVEHLGKSALEVYDLSIDIDAQVKENKAWHLPPKA